MTLLLQMAMTMMDGSTIDASWWMVEDAGQVVGCVLSSLAVLVASSSLCDCGVIVVVRMTVG